MPSFNYQAINAQGQRLSSHLEADNAEQARAQLQQWGLCPLWIKPRPIGLSWSFASQSPDIKAALLIAFARQMQSLSQSGVPLAQAIKGLAQAQQQPHWQKRLQTLQQSLESGLELSQAMEQQSPCFSQVQIRLIEVGEHTGRLDLAFASMAELLEQQTQAKRQFWQAAGYPLMVFISLLLAILILTQWVMPQFAQMFSQLEAELPNITRVLLASSDWLARWGSLLLFAFAALIVCHWRARQWPGYRLQTDKVLLSLWLIGPLRRQILLYRFSGTLATLLQQGVALMPSLALSSQVVSNSYMSLQVQEIQERITQGDSLDQAFAQSKLVDPVALEMLSVAEKTAKVAPMLHSISQYYQQQVEQGLSQLRQALEPGLLLLLTALIAVMALGIFLPLFDLYPNLLNG